MKGWIALGRMNALYTRFGQSGQKFWWALSSKELDEEKLYLYFGKVHHVCVINPKTLVFKVVERSRDGKTDHPLHTIGKPNRTEIDLKAVAEAIELERRRPKNSSEDTSQSAHTQMPEVSPS